jgi:hypothetical protein
MGKYLPVLFEENCEKGEEEKGGIYKNNGKIRRNCSVSKS